MGGPSVRLRRADGAALSTVESLLDRNDLPSGDVRSGRGRFYLGYADGLDGDGEPVPAETAARDPVAVGGLETYGADALLRSLVVVESARGEGVGSAVCDALEERARTDGVDRLYLLTTTAAAFFAARGYEEIERTDAPAAIRETTQFADLCPSSATCLSKTL
ncbi:arsenic resistance N-acetyltransferase ArsN2 [Halosimplex sp. J119]